MWPIALCISHTLTCTLLHRRTPKQTMWVGGAIWFPPAGNIIIEPVVWTRRELSLLRVVMIVCLQGAGCWCNKPQSVYCQQHHQLWLTTMHNKIPQFITWRAKFGHNNYIYYIYQWFARAKQYFNTQDLITPSTIHNVRQKFKSIKVF